MQQRKSRPLETSRFAVSNCHERMSFHGQTESAVTLVIEDAQCFNSTRVQITSC